jgi:hypothetical protein
LARREFGFYTSQTAKTFSSFTVISLVDAKKGFFPFRSRFEKVLKFCPLAEKRGSLEGVREREFKFQEMRFTFWLTDSHPARKERSLAYPSPDPKP